METFTVTFSEAVENHTKNEVTGTISDRGISIPELLIVQEKFEKLGYLTELISLNESLPVEIKAPPACILIIRGGVNELQRHRSTKVIEDEHGLSKELSSHKDVVDKKVFMYGRVVNKHARWNLCYADHAQEPDYENKRGRIIPFSSTTYLNNIRKNLPYFLGSRYQNLYAELNYYYDISKCYIGFHGDTERRIVIGVRVGADFPLLYQWYHQGIPIGDRVKLILSDGDVYFMSDKAVGNDWKRKTVPTLRHAAGFDGQIE